MRVSTLKSISEADRRILRRLRATMRETLWGVRRRVKRLGIKARSGDFRLEHIPLSLLLPDFPLCRVREVVSLARSSGKNEELEKKVQK